MKRTRHASIIVAYNIKTHEERRYREEIGPPTRDTNKRKSHTTICIKQPATPRIASQKCNDRCDFGPRPLPHSDDDRLDPLRDLCAGSFPRTTSHKIASRKSRPARSICFAVEGRCRARPCRKVFLHALCSASYLHFDAMWSISDSACGETCPPDTDDRDLCAITFLAVVGSKRIATACCAMGQLCFGGSPSRVCPSSFYFVSHGF